jgi:hypothetical protein
VPYLSLTRSHQCLPALYVHTQLNYVTRFFSRLDCYLPSLTQSYPVELPYSTPLSIRLLFTWPYTVLPSRITLPDLFPIELLPTRSYPATLSDFLTRPGNTSLHPTAYPALPNHLTQFNWPHPKTSSSASHLDLG